MTAKELLEQEGHRIVKHYTLFFEAYDDSSTVAIEECLDCNDVFIATWRGEEYIARLDAPPKPGVAPS